MPTFLLRAVRREDGQALVELALAIPILLMVVLGIVDFGRAINYWNDENHLANLGARAAAVGSIPTASGQPCSTQASSGLVSWLQCEAGQDSPELQNGSGSSTGVGGSGLSGTGAVCVSVPSTDAVGDPVTVKVKTGYNWLPLPQVLGSSSTFAQSTLAGTATMRLEAPLPSSWITTNGACS